MKKERRKFLRNTILASLAVGASVDSKSRASKLQTICNPTTLDYFGEGPFYTENPPLMTGQKLASDFEQGKRLIISGRVLNLDCMQYIPNAKIDVWHADHAGAYDNQGFNLRGYTLSDVDGFYSFETIKPGKYKNGSRFRPSHIHVKVTAPGFDTLTSQIYFEGDSDIPSDAAASIEDGVYDARNRIIALDENADGVLLGAFDFVVNGSGQSVGSKEIHLDRGMIYKASPNPFDQRIDIEYGVFQDSKVALMVFDSSGKKVAELEEASLKKEKYSASWLPESSIASGQYFVSLIINEMQVHYLKVIKL